MSSADGRVASAYLTRGMFEAAGAAAGDSENLIDVPRAIAGVEGVVLLREVSDRLWKVSLRSRGAVDVQAIARRHEGGGHLHAAGCKAGGELEPVRALFVRELVAALDPPR